VSYLTVWPAETLGEMESLEEALRQATDDDRLKRPAWLMIRSDTTARRTVCVTTVSGAEAYVHVKPAVRNPTIKHPLGHAPSDMVIGPVVGMITYIPSTKGLRVLAFDQSEGSHDGQDS
jgi:hypothetical protein